ncbi:Protein of unknown function [Cotesia congregata]|uniref:Uncharacterized protein n=1 Tax=Cotesia congregata TaxID=51543 RepID=A0A8J2MW79_COTCN|nr:Protein of unknown function [Cotesia congregata]
MKRVTYACDASMPRKRGINPRPSVHWWNDYISVLRKECHKKRRISQRNYQRPNSVELIAEYKKACRELNKAIKESKRRCWKELIYEVDMFNKYEVACLTNINNAVKRERIGVTDNYYVKRSNIHVTGFFGRKD